MFRFIPVFGPFLFEIVVSQTAATANTQPSPSEPLVALSLHRCLYIVDFVTVFFFRFKNFA